tara:strand:- start:26 stop:502 length:477 start_codon:yes stop_codon:yes gene_type:complete
MALPVTDQLITQMMTENVRTSPTTPMEGNVSRPMIVSDLLSAMRDINFSQLMTEYGNMSGNPSKESTPMITGLMKESVKVPETPLEQQQKKVKKPSVATGGPAQSAQQISSAVENMTQENAAIPTPMTDAMATNTMAPLGTLVEQNGGLMSNAPQQIA